MKWAWHILILVGKCFEAILHYKFIYRNNIFIIIENIFKNTDLNDFCWLLLSMLASFSFVSIFCRRFLDVGSIRVRGSALEYGCVYLIIHPSDSKITI
jgi:hypothetical protein